MITIMIIPLTTDANFLTALYVLNFKVNTIIDLLSQITKVQVRMKGTAKDHAASTWWD